MSRMTLKMTFLAAPAIFSQGVDIKALWEGSSLDVRGNHDQAGKGWLD
jgi:hypothetical protein